MWALVKNNSVIETFQRSKAMTIDTIQYPKNIFELWTEEALNKIGIYKVVESGSEKNSSLYTTTSKTEFANNKVTKTYINTENDLTESKEKLLYQINDFLSQRLTSTDWVVIREQETSKAKPSNLATWRTNLRTKHSELETAINNASSVSALEAIDINSGWPDDPRT